MKKHVLVLILIATLIVTMFLLVACTRGVVCSDHDWRPYVIAEDGSVQSEICNNCGITRLLCNPHKWKSHTDNGDLTHTSTCEQCGLKEVQKHRFEGEQPQIHEAVVCMDCGAQFLWEILMHLLMKTKMAIAINAPTLRHVFTSMMKAK